MPFPTANAWPRAEGLRAGGQVVAAEALHPGHIATTLRFRDGALSMTDGPFAETKEQLAGFYLFEATRPRRSARARGEDPAGARRQHRGAAGARARSEPLIAMSLSGRRRRRRASPSGSRAGAGPCARAGRRRARARRRAAASSRALPPRPLPCTSSASAKTATLTTASLASRSTSVRPRPPLPCSLSSSRPKTSSRSVERQAGDARRHRADDRRRQRLVVAFEIEEGLAAALARQQVGAAREQAEAARPGEQQHRRRRAGEVVRRLRSRLEVDQRGDRLAVAAPARQARRGDRVDAAVAAEDEQRVDAAALEGAVHRVARLEGELAGARSRGPSAPAPSPSC